MTVKGYETLANDPCEYLLELEADAAEFALALDEACQKNKTYTLDGYAPGQAPRAAVEAKEGETFFYYDAVNLLIERDLERSIEEVCAKEGWTPLTKPRIDISACGAKEGVTVVAIFFIAPTVTLGQYKGLTFAYPSIPCPEGAVEAQLELLRQRVAAGAGKDAPLPALDDAFAAQCGAEDLATLREEIAAGLAQHIGAQSRRQGIYLLLEEIGRNCTMFVSPVLANAEYERGMQGLRQNLAAHGVSLEAYLAQHGKTEAEFEDDQRAGAMRALRGKMAAYTIARAEGIVVKPIEVESEQVRLAGKFKINVFDFKAEEPAFLVKNDLTLTRTLAFLTKNNTLVEEGAAVK